MRNSVELKLLYILYFVEYSIIIHIFIYTLTNYIFWAIEIVSIYFIDGKIN